ncbi:MAG: DUF3160 domain-containing protein [Bacteroidetes bacterium]|jgi:hypothetical protein|nr:DUF3160 domain-containing protein [Bacteroidota bacterium]
MKLLAKLLLFILLGTIPVDKINSQVNFDTETYQTFLTTNQSYSTDQILEANPPQTDYYVKRQFPASPHEIACFPSIDSVYQFTNYEKQLLTQNHFMVTERQRNNSWAQSFIQIYSNDLPLFISSDFILHSLHRSYDEILMELEKELLEPNLKILLQSMYDSYTDLYQKYSQNSDMLPALSDVDLYIAVALSLSKNNTYLPQHSNREMYDLVMNAIEVQQLVNLNLFTDDRIRKLDFSQYKPRGHYTHEFYEEGNLRTLKDYFVTMMWLGRIDFLLTGPPENPWETDWTQEELQRMQIAAVLLNELLNTCGDKNLLDTHENIISFLVGPDDNLTPDELTSLVSDHLESPEDILNENNFDVFTNALNASDDYGQKIMSNFFYVDPKSSDPGKLPVSYKLLGQKFILDSYIASEVVYDRIVWDEDKIYRGMPDPLDVMAVLGNEDALMLMQDEMKKFHYAYKINALQELISYYDDGFWEQSLYNSWLSAIRTLNPPETSDNLPYFMQTTAWHHEKLNTQLTSWAELRHDNILYAKQSYTGATGCSFPYTYIEPYPSLYQKIKKIAYDAQHFFDDLLGSDHKITRFYESYGNLMSHFTNIAEKELNAIPLNDTEVTFLKTMINGTMASGPSISGWFNDLFYTPYKAYGEDFIVADIHTQPTDEHGNVVGNVYHVGSGYINQGVFFAPNPVRPKQIMAFTGPVASFHYDITSNFERHSDEEWETKFGMQSDMPKRPDWVNIYLANEKGEAYPDGRKLHGKTYTGKLTNVYEPKLSDYLLAFPNPARNKINIRLMLNNQSDIQATIYDMRGRVVQRMHHTRLLPAEHNLVMNIDHLQPGQYIVQIQLDKEMITKKITIL